MQEIEWISRDIPRRTCIVAVDRVGDVCVPFEDGAFEPMFLDFGLGPPMGEDEWERLEALWRPNSRMWLSQCRESLPVWVHDDTDSRHDSLERAVLGFLGGCSSAVEVTGFPIVAIDADRWERRRIRRAVRHALSETVDQRLHRAARDGDVDSVRRAIRLGWPLCTFDELGYTPLHAAAVAGHLEVISMLVEAGADVNAQDETRIGHTAVATVVRRIERDLQRVTEVVRLLLDLGADPRLSGWMGLNALDHAEGLRIEEGRAIHAMMRRAVARLESNG